MKTHVAQWKYFTERRGCPIKILRRGYKILRGIGYFSTPVEVLDICLTHVGEKFFAICLRKCLKSCLSSFYGLFYHKMNTSKVLHLAGMDDWIWVSLNPPTRNWIFYVISMNTDIVISLFFSGIHAVSFWLNENGAVVYSGYLSKTFNALDKRLTSSHHCFKR